jgi:hypothetical protein
VGTVSSGLIAAEGETTWFEGLLLIGVYLLFALTHCFENSAGSKRRRGIPLQLRCNSPASSAAIPLQSAPAEIECK